jgi:Protein of unknown function (DUF2798)
MTRPARFLLATIMTSMMVFMVTLVATLINLGPRPDFVLQWAKAYFVSWPIAATTAFLVMPMAQRLTVALMARFGKSA